MSHFKPFASTLFVSLESVFFKNRLSGYKVMNLIENKEGNLQITAQNMLGRH
jgi:hypothetical protein